MKLVIYLLSLLLIQVKAYFIDELRGAMHHVETGFEKMLTDVVSDMEDTLHCTISAVEHVLYIHGIFDEPTNYQDKCRGSSTYNVHDPATRPSIYEGTNSDNHVRDAINKHIYDSISHVNKTLSQLINKNENCIFKSVTGNLENETKRLNEVSEMLRKELENIANNVKNGKIGIDYSSKDAIWNDIKSLEMIEKSSNNSSEVNEVREMYNKALSVLTTNADMSDDKFNTIISELHKDLDNKNEEVKNNQEKPQPSDTVQNFREKEDSFLNHESQGYETLKNNQEVPVTSGALQDFRNKEDSLLNHKSTFDDFESFFTINNNPETVENVNSVIEESRKAEMLFESLSNVGSSVFDDSKAFFNF